MALNSKSKAALVFAAFIVLPLAGGSAALLTWLRPTGSTNPAGKHWASAQGAEIVPEAAPWVPPDPSAAGQPAQNLARFKGVSPWGLVQATEIGAELQSLVPTEQAWCLKDAFANYLPSLTLGSDGSLGSSRDESNAERGVSAFFMVAPGGGINIVLQCDPDATHGESGKTYQFFTNNGVRAIPSKQVLDWLRVVGRAGDIVVKSDGKTTVEVAFEDFMLLPGMTRRPVPKLKAAAKRATLTSLNDTPPYIGRWACQAAGPDSPEGPVTFQFNLDGGFAYSTDRVENRGTYQIDGERATIHIARVWLDGKKNFPADVSEALTFAEAPSGQLKFGMTRGTAGLMVQYECAPKHEVSSATN